MKESGHDTVQQGSHFTELEEVTCLVKLSLLLKVLWKNKDHENGWNNKNLFKQVQEEKEILWGLSHNLKDKI